MKSQRIPYTVPLIGSIINRPYTEDLGEVSNTQEFINCFPDVSINSITRSGTANLLKRPGYTASSSLGSIVSSYGACVWLGSSTGKAVFSFNDNATPSTLYVYNSSRAIVGAGLASMEKSYRTRIRLADTKVSNGAATVDPYLTMVATKTGNTYPSVFYIKEGAGAWTELTDADWPPNLGTSETIVGNVVHMDGYMFAMTDKGRIYNTDLNSLSAVTATSFIDAQSVTDGGIALARTKSHVLAFGASSIERFYNAGNATGSPLSKVPNGVIRLGAKPFGTEEQAYEIVKAIGDDVYFIGMQPESSTKGIFVISDSGVTKISTTTVDRLVNSANSGDYYIAGSVTMSGQQIVMFGDASAGGSTRTLCYSVTTKVWWYADLGNQVYACAADNGLAKIGAYSNGSIIYLGGFVYSDSAAAYPMTVVTEEMDFGTSNKKFLHSLEVICDTQETSGNLSVYTSYDNGATYRLAGTIDTSTGTRRVTRLGSTSRNYNNKIKFKIVETVIRAFRGTALRVNYTVGSS